MNFKKLTTIIISIAITAFLWAGVSFAQQSPVLPKNSQTKEQKESAENAEIKKRKQMLLEVLKISKSEIENLELSVEKIKTEEKSDWRAIKEKLAQELFEAKKYYAETEEKINSENLSLEDIKKTAENLKEWREKNYTPKLKTITNLILIFEEDFLLKIAQSRFEKISQDFKKLNRQKYLKTDSLKNLLDKSSLKISNIKKSTDEAKIIFLEENKDLISQKDNTEKTQEEKISATAKESDKKTETPKPQEKIIDAKISDNKNQEQKQNAIEDRQNTIRDILKESLVELKEVYEIFFQMNDLIKKSI